MAPLHSETVAVAGLGRSGQAAVAFLVQARQPVLAWDRNDAAVAAVRGLPGVTALSGDLPADALARCRSVLLSPGIPRSHPGLAASLDAGTEVINDVEWLHRHVRGQGSQAPFLAITGTNGKSTVTTLVGDMLAESALRTRVGGNLGTPALALWAADADAYVLELSSFQLESIDTFRPRVAALLNLSPDHLDRYADIDGYLAAKARIFANQTRGDVAVINRDDPLLRGTAETLGQRGIEILPFSLQDHPVEGVYCADGQLVDGRRGRHTALLPLAEIRLVGRHNHANAAAAAAVALAAGASPEAVCAVLRRFPGLPHRMAWVARVDDVDYYNDSKGTNVGAVIESLQSFPNGVVLIAGGRDKKGLFHTLAPVAARFARAVILIGEAAPAMEQALHGCCPLVRAADMTEAVHSARRLARPGQSVLLSPACASFDMFDNFEHRGDCFQEAVHGLR